MKQNKSPQHRTYQHPTNQAPIDQSTMNQRHKNQRLKNQTKQNQETIDQTSTSTPSSFWTKISHLTESRYSKMVMLLIFSAVYFISFQNIFDQKPDLNGDNFAYYDLAQSLSQGKGYTNSFDFYHKPHTHFPPGYPAFISLFVQHTEHPVLLIKRLNGVLFYLALIILFFILLRLTIPVFLAGLSIIVLPLHGELMRWTTIMMSEELFIFTSMLCLWLTLELIHPTYLKSKTWATTLKVILLALSVSYIYLIRSMGMSLIIAIILALLIAGLTQGFKAGFTLKGIQAKLTKGLHSKQSPEPLSQTTSSPTAAQVQRQQRHHSQVLLLAAFFVATSFFTTAGLWSHRNAQLGITTSSYKGDFLKKKNGKTMTTWADWEKRISINTTQYITNWLPQGILLGHQTILTKPTLGRWVLGLILIVLIIFGISYRPESRWVLLLYLGSTLVVLILYPTQFGGMRYLVPIIPLGLAFFFSGLHVLFKMIDQKIRDHSFVSLYIPTLLALLIFICFQRPTFHETSKYYHTLAQIDTYKRIEPEGRAIYISMSEWCKRNLPATSRMACRKPWIYHYYSNREAIAFPQYGTEQEIIDFIEANKIDYILIDIWYPHAYRTIYPAIFNNQEKFKIVAKEGKLDAEKGIYPTLVVQYKLRDQ